MHDEELSDDRMLESARRFLRDFAAWAAGLSTPDFRRLLWETEEEWGLGDGLDPQPRESAEIVAMLAAATDEQLAALTREDVARLLQHENADVRLAGLRLAARGIGRTPSGGQ